MMWRSSPRGKEGLDLAPKVSSTPRIILGKAHTTNLLIPDYKYDQALTPCTPIIIVFKD